MILCVSRSEGESPFNFFTANDGTDFTTTFSFLGYYEKFTLSRAKSIRLTATDGGPRTLREEEDKNTKWKLTG